MSPRLAAIRRGKISTIHFSPSVLPAKTRFDKIWPGKFSGRNIAMMRAHRHYSQIPPGRDASRFAQNRYTRDRSPPAMSGQIVWNRTLPVCHQLKAEKCNGGFALHACQSLPQR
jgi:hypothetical protein